MMTPTDIVKMLAHVERQAGPVYLVPVHDADWIKVKALLELERADFAAVPVTGPEGSGRMVVTNRLGRIEGRYDAYRMNGKQGSEILFGGLKHAGDRKIVVSENWSHAMQTV